MRYWVYQDCRILGPFPPEDIASVAGIGHDSLVCEEKAAGMAEGDWRQLGAVDELSTMLLSGSAAVAASEIGKFNWFQEESQAALEAIGSLGDWSGAWLDEPHRPELWPSAFEEQAWTEGTGGQWQTSDFEDRLAHLKEELFSSEERRDELRRRLEEKDRSLEELRRRLGLPPEERRRAGDPAAIGGRRPADAGAGPVEDDLPVSEALDAAPGVEAADAPPPAETRAAQPPAPAKARPVPGQRKSEPPPPSPAAEPVADLVLEDEPPTEAAPPVSAAVLPAKASQPPSRKAAPPAAVPPAAVPAPASSVFGSFIPEPTPLKSTASLSQGSSFEMPAQRPPGTHPAFAAPPPAAAPPPFPTMDMPEQTPQAELSPPAFIEPSTMEPMSPPAFVESSMPPGLMEGGAQTPSPFSASPGGGIFQPPPAAFDQPQTMIYSGGAPGGLFGGNPGGMVQMPQGGEVTLPGLGAPAPTEGGWGTAQIQGQGGMMESPATPIPITNPASFPQPIPLFEGQPEPYGEAVDPFPQQNPMATLGGSMMSSTSGGSPAAAPTGSEVKAKPKHSKGFLIALVVSFLILTGVAVVFLRNPKDLIMLISMSPQKKASGEDAPVDGGGAYAPSARTGESRPGTSGTGSPPPAQAPARSPFPSSPPSSVQAPAASQRSPEAALPQAIPRSAAPAASAKPQPEPAPAQQPAPAQPRGHDFIQDDGARAIEFVKNYKVSKERGTVGQLLQYYFLAAGNKEDWNSGAIEANVFWVTYRVIQSGKKESGTQPISYLFEVDLAKGTLKGTNPASKELLGLSSSKPAAAPPRSAPRPAAPSSSARRKSAAPRPAARHAAKPRPAQPEDPEPLPDEEELVSARPKKSSGFNNPGADSVELTP